MATVKIPAGEHTLTVSYYKHTSFGNNSGQTIGAYDMKITHNFEASNSYSLFYIRACSHYENLTKAAKLEAWK